MARREDRERKDKPQESRKTQPESGFESRQSGKTESESESESKKKFGDRESMEGGRKSSQREEDEDKEGKSDVNIPPRPEQPGHGRGAST